MLKIESTIRAYRGVLNSFKFSEPTSFSEDFAQKRYLKKYQEPDPSISQILSNNCWENWISNDLGLPSLRNKTLLPEWYVARARLHEALRGFRLGEANFPRGSEFTPTRGHNSLEARLCASDWTCTHENFAAFSKLCYNHAGLKRAVRKRYSNWFARRNFDISRRESDRMLFRAFAGSRTLSFDIFCWKLERIVTFTQGSRFSTVPKNNEKRRPINVEPFANILTQSAIGTGIRNVLKVNNIDLDHLQGVHRRRISDVGIATIDLKDASDSISLDLVEFLLPAGVFTKIMNARSGFVLGPDGSYHLTKKVSSMGNGFTFELMTLILTFICRVLDPTSSVYGDDIIIDSSCAPRLITLLQSVGLKVNIDKSFIDGPFRESCGGNFHKEEGYIRSFDFLYPENINDCMMILNKAYYLRSYPSFQKLYQSLCRVTPPALQGGPCERFDATDPLDLVGSHRSCDSAESTDVFPPFFVTPKRGYVRVSGNARCALKSIGYDPDDFAVVQGFEYVPKERSQQLRHLSSSRWAKYLMYLASGRRSKDVVTSVGSWDPIFIATSGQEFFRLKALKSQQLVPSG